MPKKKPIAKRLKNLFEDVKPEQAPAEPKPASRKRAAPEKPVQPIEPKPVERVTQPVEMVSQAAYQDSVMSLAFQAGQNSWATLQVVDETEQRKWSQDEQLLVKQVADQLSLALENARLFNETQARAEELSVLNEMGRELSSKLEAQAIAETVYRYTSRLMDTSNLYVALYDEKKDEKSYPVMFEEGRQVHVEPSKLGNRGFSDYIIRNKRVVFAPSDVLGQMKSLGIEFVPLDKDDTPSQCWLGVPILIGERVLGLISVQSVKTPNAYDVHDRDILTTIASQAAIALENARLFQETQASAEELSVLNEMGRELTAQLEIAAIAEVVYRYTGRLMDTSNFFLALYDEKNQEKIFPLAFE
ncbi:MAG: GAF domain-containing protein [Anaerolineales bacterium]